LARGARNTALLRETAELLQTSTEEADMRKASNVRRRQQNDFELLQGGQLPGRMVRRHFASLRKTQTQEIQKKFAIRQVATKYLDQLRPGATSEDKAAISGLRAITERLAEQKLPQPRKLIVPPYGLWGSYTLRFTPPYPGLGTYSVGSTSCVTGTPTISASGIDSLGQLSCSVATDFNSASASSGTASNQMGIYFRPLFTNATVQVTFDSEVVYSWYANSIDNNKEADAYVSGGLQLYRYDGAFVPLSLGGVGVIGVSVGTHNTLWFDFGSKVDNTWPLVAPVSSEYFYFAVISLTCQASGVGWPGSIAGASATVTVPSITVTVTANPVIAPTAL
jgi:hypothetical protein